VNVVAKFYDVKRESIINSQLGQKKQNLPSSLAIYLSQKYKDLPLKDIAIIFNLKNSRSTSSALSKINNLLKAGNLFNIYRYNISF
jgi:chromosomal replication initiation ATPase DnaA